MVVDNFIPLIKEDSLSDDDTGHGHDGGNEREAVEKWMVRVRVAREI